MKTKYTKNNWMHFTLALGLMGAMATAVHAESFSAEVPFAFEAAGKSFPAGVYTVDSVSGGVIMIHNAASGEAAVGAVASGAVSHGRMIEIETSGARIHVPEGVDVRTLSIVLAALRRAS